MSGPADSKAGRRVPDRQVHGLTATVVRYLVRSAGRPTPFGLFAGVALVRFGPTASLRFGSAHRTVCRADATWLDEIIGELEAGPVLMCLDVVFNSLAFERAGQLVIPRAAGRAEIGLTDPVAVVRDTARDPVRFVNLADVLAAKFPDVASDRIEELLRRLVAEEFLITSLRAPMTCVDALGHLVGDVGNDRAVAIDRLARQPARDVDQGIDLRLHPARDEKVLTGWNGLMLAAFAEAARVLKREDYRMMAEGNADLRDLRRHQSCPPFIRSDLDGRVRTSRNPRERNQPGTNRNAHV